MPNVRLQLLSALNSNDVQLLEAIDYVFFLETCDQQHCRPQITPIRPEQALVGPNPEKMPQHQTHAKQTVHKQLAQKTVLNEGSRHFTPGQLLHQARSLYGWHPQAWRLNIPAALEGAETAQNPRVIQALDAIAVFLRCYATPQ